MKMHYSHLSNKKLDFRVWFYCVGTDHDRCIMVTKLSVNQSASSDMVLAGNSFPCCSLANHVEINLRECQGSEQHTLRVRGLEGITDRKSFLPTLRTARRIKKGRSSCPLFPGQPLEGVRPVPCESVTLRLL